MNHTSTIRKSLGYPGDDAKEPGKARGNKKDTRSTRSDSFTEQVNHPMKDPKKYPLCNTGKFRCHQHCNKLTANAGMERTKIPERSVATAGKLRCHKHDKKLGSTCGHGAKLGRPAWHWCWTGRAIDQDVLDTRPNFLIRRVPCLQRKMHGGITKNQRKDMA